MFVPSSATHKEFASTTQIVSLSLENSEFRVTGVTYTHEDDIRFSDMKITFSENRFTYSSKFEYSVRRGVSYTQYNEETREITYGHARNVTELPSNYASAYKFDPPKESALCTFHVSALRRDKVESEDEMGNVTTYWTDWYSVWGNFVATIETDNNATQKYVQKVASESYYAKNSFQQMIW